MIVFSNHRVGAVAELLVSEDIAAKMLMETAEAARDTAIGRWEQELVSWLETRAGHVERDQTIDVEDIAWSPDNFERQRRFVLEAIDRASRSSGYSRALRLWAQLIEAHPREFVQFGRRWMWQPSA